MILRNSTPRPGYVLIAVLIVIVVLSLMAYRFSDSMVSEYRAGVRTADTAKVRAAAASGVHYAMALLADPDTLANQVGDPFNNPGVFQDVLVGTDPNNPNKELRFSVIAVVPTAPGVYEQRYGVIDEAGKLNINALIANDPRGAALFKGLMKLPNMTPEVADAIVDWVDADDIPGNPDTGGGGTPGAEMEHYQSLAAPYQVKNGPLNSLDELLLVKGVTPQLLYGTDRNSNGIGDDGGSFLDRGWSDYLTVHGRELNVDSTGTLRIWINGDDPKAIHQALVPAVGDEMAAYIMAWKLLGRSAQTRLDENGNPVQRARMTAKSDGKGGTSVTVNMSGSNQEQVEVGSLDELIAAVQSKLDEASSSGGAISSIVDLMQTRITLPTQNNSGGGGGGGGRSGGNNRGGSGGKDGGKEVRRVYYSPLNDPNRRAELLPLLLDRTTTKEAVEMVPRLNVMIAPREVIAGLPGLEDADADAIVSARQGITPGSPASFSPAWLVTSANLSRNKFKRIEKYVTTSTMMYRVEAVGYFTGGGPVARVEAIIDTNMGAPRIVYFRDLGDLDYPRAYQPGQQK